MTDQSLPTCIYALLQSSPDDEFRASDIHDHVLAEGFNVNRARVATALHNLRMGMRKRDPIFRTSHGFYSASPL